MSETTEIHPDKVRAFLATDYRPGHTDQDIVLTIGKHSGRPTSPRKLGKYRSGV